MTRVTVYDVAVKARTSTGYTVTEYFGTFGNKELSDFGIGSLNADSTFGFVVRNDDQMKEGNLSCIQFAVLFTN